MRAAHLMNATTDRRRACGLFGMVSSQRYVNAPWRYERIEGANHWIPLTAPDELNPLLLDYLSTTSSELTHADQ